MAIFSNEGNTIRIKFLADTTSIGQGVAEAGNGITKGLGLATLGWAAAGTAAVAFGKQSIDAALAAEDAQQHLADAYAKFPALHDATLKSLTALSDATQQKTRYDHIAAEAAEVTLAQFHLTGQQILQLLPLVEDFAAKTGKTLPDAAESVGKALLGQTRALKAVGINYKSTGDAAQDYRNIVLLLTQQVGDAAEKDAQTTAGRLAMMKNQYSELQEKIGQALLPLINDLAPAIIWLLNVLVLSLHGWMLAFSALGDVAQSVAGVVASVLQAIVGAAEWVIGVFNDVAAAFVWAGGVLNSVFGGAVAAVSWLLTGLWGNITDVADAVGGVFAGAWHVAEGAINAVAGAIEWVIGKLHALAGIWNTVGGVISKIGSVIGIHGAPAPPGATGAPTLALAGTGSSRALSGPATVTPGGLVVNVNVHGNVGDPNLIGRRVVDALATYTRTNGTRALRTGLGLA